MADNPSLPWTTKIFNFVLYATYNAVRSVRAEGDQKSLATDSTGALLVRTVGDGEEGAVSEDGHATAGYLSSLQLRTGARKLRSLYGFNNGASTRYVQVFDAVAAPSAGANPPVSFPVEAGKPFSIDYRPGRKFAVGIFVGISSTGDSYTADGTATFRLHGRTEAL